jgi:hypothetical protein
VTPLVVLGGEVQNKQDLPSGEFAAKPYHNAPLVRKIEALLSVTGQTAPRDA